MPYYLVIFRPFSSIHVNWPIHQPISDACYAWLRMFREREQSCSLMAVGRCVHCHRKGGGCAISVYAVCLSLLRSVCHSVCDTLRVQDCCKSNQAISLIFGPISRKNCSSFGGNPVPDTDSGPLFHFPTTAE